MILLTQIRHPDYSLDCNSFEKWRICYKGGDPFIHRYLQRFSEREDDGNFLLRQKIAYGPVLAKSALNEIRNSIYQRMAEINRIGGPKNYQEAVKGLNAGVDLHGSSMNAYMGQDVLTELLQMGKVGVYIDKPRIDDKLLSKNKGKKPYLYYYARENILSWDSQYIEDDEVYTNVLLRAYILKYDTASNLPLGYQPIFRHFYINTEGKVKLDIWEEYVDEDDREQKLKSRLISSYILDIDEIPFTVMDIGGSLMEDISNYQIALLNLASSDLNYALQSNFPFYVEQYDPISDQPYTRKLAPPKIDPNNPLVSHTKLDIAQQGTQTLGNTSSSVDDIRVGATKGRKYGKGLNAPDFIAPPSEPLMASMKKQEQMKAELRQIINLSLSNIAPVHASADSKKQDNSGLENGLSGIGLELEYGERRIAKIWAKYENSNDIPEVNYPRKYDIKSDGDRQEESKALNGLKGAAPSKTYAKEIGKQIASTMLSGKVKAETLDLIHTEIDKAEFITSDAKEIQGDVESGLVSKETASNARGYDGKKEVPIAEKEHQDRLAAIAASQADGVGAARGVGGNSGDAKVEKQDSQNPDKNPTSGGGLTRGDGK